MLWPPRREADTSRRPELTLPSPDGFFGLFCALEAIFFLPAGRLAEDFLPLGRLTPAFAPVDFAFATACPPPAFAVGRAAASRLGCAFRPSSVLLRTSFSWLAPPPGPDFNRSRLTSVARLRMLLSPFALILFFKFVLSNFWSWSRSNFSLLRSTFFQSMSFHLTLPSISTLLKQLSQSTSMSPPQSPPQTPSRPSRR